LMLSLRPDWHMALRDWYGVCVSDVSNVHATDRTNRFQASGPLTHTVFLDWLKRWFVVVTDTQGAWINEKVSRVL